MFTCATGITYINLKHTQCQINSKTTVKADG